MTSELTHLTKDQAAHVDRANAYWQGEIKSGRGVGVYAFLLGAELTALKAGLQHGEWLTFLKTHLPDVKPRTATERMALFSKSAESADLPPMGNIKLLGDGSVPKEYADKIADWWHEHGDGKTITRFMRDTGVIREKIPPAHHPLTHDRKAEIEEELKGPVWGYLKAELLLLKPDEVREAETPFLREFETVLKAACRLVSQVLQERKSNRNPNR